MQNISKLQNDLNYYFTDKQLLILALTHASYANEHGVEKYYTNQRLEFLGDAILELICSDYLYKNYPYEDEGFLTKTRANLVCEETLSIVARELKVYDYMRYGNGEDVSKIKNNDSIMCDTLESIFGAIYIDSNIDEVKKIVNKYILIEKNLYINNDYKSKIQEIANANKVIIKYVVDKEIGPAHNKKFYVSIHYGNIYIGNGVGKTKKEAEQNAAKKVLEYIK